MIKKALLKNGLTEKEAVVYLAILELGEAPIGRIASKAGMKRTTVYSIIDALKSKGMVMSSKRKGVISISVLSPQILIERFKNASLMAEGLLPELMALAYSSPLKPRLRFFEGIDGVKEALLEFSYSKVPSMGFTDYEKMPAELFQYIRKTIVPQRRKRNNRIRLIVPDNTTNDMIQKEDRLHFSEHRLVSFPLAEGSSIELLLFETSKVVFLSFAGHEMFAVILDSAAIYNTLKNIFLLIWENTNQK